MSSNEFLDKEIEKIINDKKYEAPFNMAMAGAFVMGHFKGVNLKILDLRKVAGIADAFLIGSASNPTQAAAMSEEIARQMRMHGHEAISREGFKQGADWILLDYGDIIFHVFLESHRYVYDLDSLYAKAESIEIPQEYYYADTPSSMKPVGDDRGYF